MIYSREVARHRWRLTEVRRQGEHGKPLGKSCPKVRHAFRRTECRLRYFGIDDGQTFGGSDAAEIRIGAYKGGERCQGVQAQRRCELDGIQGAQTVGESMLHQELLCPVEMNGSDWHDLPQVPGDVCEEATAHEVEIGSRDLAGADQASQDRVQFDDAEVGEEVASAGLGKEGIDLGGAQLDALMFDGGTGIKEAIGHPGILGLAFGAFGIHRLGECERNLGESLPHGIEAYTGVGVV